MTLFSSQGREKFTSSMRRFLSIRNFSPVLTILTGALVCFHSISCSSQRGFSGGDLSDLQKLVEESPVFNSSFTGFALYDPETDEYLYKFHSDKYFVPASNGKILTFYISNQLLGQTIPALKYITYGDSLIFWGTGDPRFLNPDFTQDSLVFNFLKNRKERLFFCPYNFTDKPFGNGWMWDDYLSDYQPEKSPFPIYGNTVEFSREAGISGLAVRPGYFYSETQLDTRLGGEKPQVNRSLRGNRFTYNVRAIAGESFDSRIPFEYSPELVALLLSDTLNRPVEVLDLKLMPPPESQVIYSTPADTLYRRLLQDSDNFVAEQLLLLCAERKFGVLSSDKIIQWAMDSLLNTLPQPPRMYDGSGLSRYNMVTPEAMVAILDTIYETHSWERLFRLFPTGGINGTLKNWYPGIPPYVVAKTGTMTHVHNLSGYLITRNRKTLVFSFMHNNFTSGSYVLKREMEKVLSWIRDHY